MRRHRHHRRHKRPRLPSAPTLVGRTLWPPRRDADKPRFRCAETLGGRDVVCDPKLKPGGGGGRGQKAVFTLRRVNTFKCPATHCITTGKAAPWPQLQSSGYFPHRDLHQKMWFAKGWKKWDSQLRFGQDRTALPHRFGGSASGLRKGSSSACRRESSVSRRVRPNV